MINRIVIPMKAGIRNRLKQPDSIFHRNDNNCINMLNFISKFRNIN